MATNGNMDTTAVAGNEDERKLFAGGFPQDATEAQIKEHFGQFGEIETFTLKTDMATGRSKEGSQGGISKLAQYCGQECQKLDFAVRTGAEPGNKEFRKNLLF